MIVNSTKNKKTDNVLIELTLRSVRVTNVAVENCGKYTHSGARGGVVVKALRYKPAGRGVDSRWCHWNFSVT